MDAVYLGADGHGDWIGFPPGTHMARPGVELVTKNHQVGLVPPAAWRPRSTHDRLRVPIGLREDGAAVHLDLKESAQHGMGPTDW